MYLSSSLLRLLRMYHYGGIIRQVWLEELPVNPIRQVQVITEDWSSGKILVKVEFAGAPIPLKYSIDGGEYLGNASNCERRNSAFPTSRLLFPK